MNGLAATARGPQSDYLAFARTQAAVLVTSVLQVRPHEAQSGDKSSHLRAEYDTALIVHKAM